MIKKSHFKQRIHLFLFKYFARYVKHTYVLPSDGRLTSIRDFEKLEK